MSLREQEVVRHFWSEGIASLQLGCSKGVVRAVITKAAEQSLAPMGHALSHF